MPAENQHISLNTEVFKSNSERALHILMKSSKEAQLLWLFAQLIYGIASASDDENQKRNHEFVTDEFKKICEQTWKDFLKNIQEVGLSSQTVKALIETYNAQYVHVFGKKIPIARSTVQKFGIGTSSEPTLTLIEKLNKLSVTPDVDKERAKLLVEYLTTENQQGKNNNNSFGFFKHCFTFFKDQMDLKTQTNLQATNEEEKAELSSEQKLTPK